MRQRLKRKLPGDWRLTQNDYLTYRLFGVSRPPGGGLGVHNTWLKVRDSGADSHEVAKGPMVFATLHTAAGKVVLDGTPSEVVECIVLLAANACVEQEPDEVNFWESGDSSVTVAEPPKGDTIIANINPSGAVLGIISPIESLIKIYENFTFKQ